MNAKVNKADLLKKELSVSSNIPYANHITRNIVKLSTGDYLSVFRLEGIAHESADDEDINQWHENMNTFLRNIASPNIAVWSHVIRRETLDYPVGDYSDTFTQALNEKYKKHITSGAKMFLNELYISLVYRPHPTKADRALSKIEKADKGSAANEQAASIEKLNELGVTVTESLRRYGVEPLGIYTKNEIAFSEISEFLGFLVNGEWQTMPLARSTIAHTIPTSRLFFGKESIAIQTPEKTFCASVLGIKEYPSLTGPGMLDNLLSMPFGFVMTQSFIFTPKQEALSMLTRQRDIMINAGDLAESQIDEIGSALDDLVSNRYVMGSFHFSLMVMADTTKEMQQAVGMARTALADTSMVVAREDLANEAAFWAQLPGNFSYRTRPASVTSKNFAGFSALHNFPTGKPHGNHWGEAVALLKTSSGSPYYFNFHRADLGNTLIIGPSGSGKTVTQGFLLAMLEKFKPTGVFFDKDRGAEIFIRAMKGEYHPLLTGETTGWNPFQMEATPANLSFLNQLLQIIAKKPNGEPLTVQEEGDLSAALAGLMALPMHLRRIGQVLAFLDPTNPEGIFYRIQKWTHGFSLGWVFDNEEDNLDMSRSRLYGFDMTQLLDNKEIRTASLFYLMHRMNEVINGQRFVCFMDEFWKLLMDDVFEDFAQNKLKTIRKLNGLLIFGTQDPRDTLNSPIAHTIVGQCPTQIFMPNPKANHDDYVKGFHLSEREYEIVKTLPENSRQFLVKQGHNSVVAELNLRGFDDELAVLSGTATNVQLLNDVVEQIGSADPDQWLPVFQKMRVNA